MALFERRTEYIFGDDPRDIEAVLLTAAMFGVAAVGVLLAHQVDPELVQSAVKFLQTMPNVLPR